MIFVYFLLGFAIGYFFFRQVEKSIVDDRINTLRRLVMDTKMHNIDLLARVRFIEGILKIKEYSMDWKVEDDG